MKYKKVIDAYQLYWRVLVMCKIMSCSQAGSTVIKLWFYYNL